MVRMLPETIRVHRSDGVPGPGTMGTVHTFQSFPDGLPDHVLLTPDTTHAPSPDVTAASAGRSPEQLRVVAVQIAAAAARHVRDARHRAAGADGRIPVAATKSSEVDPVTAVDRSSEALVRAMLARSAPQDVVLGEEDGGELVTGTVVWVVDPIDGTVNFIYGIPASAVSIAATVDGFPVAGAVADIARRRIYSGCIGGDALVAPEPGSVTDPGSVPGSAPRSAPGQSTQARILAPDGGPGDLSRALVGTGFSYSAQRRSRQAALLVTLLPQIRDIRRLGSAALDLCAVASGALDAYYEHGLGPWDHAAGSLIAARAGRTVFMPRLSAGYDDGVGVFAAAPGVADELAGQVVPVRM